MLYSAVVFVSALVSCNGRGAVSALGNMVNIVLASVVEVLNIACSIISLFTRSIATMANFGYSDSQLTPAQRRTEKLIDNIDNYPAPTERAERHAQKFCEELTKELDAAALKLRENEKEIHITTFTLV